MAYDDVFARDVPGVIVDHASNPLEHFAESVTNHSTVPADVNANWPIISAYRLSIAEDQSGTYMVSLGARPSEPLIEE